MTTKRKKKTTKITDDCGERILLSDACNDYITISIDGTDSFFEYSFDTREEALDTLKKLRTLPVYKQSTVTKTTKINL